MDELPKEVELQVGRRSQDGKVRLSAHIPDLLTISVEYGAARASTVMLTADQVRELRRVLADMEQLIERRQETGGEWDGAERRRPAA